MRCDAEPMQMRMRCDPMRSDAMQMHGVLVLNQPDRMLHFLHGLNEVRRASRQGA